MKIKFLGVTKQKYSGMDSSCNTEIKLVAGQEIEISDEQAERLLKDYPKDFVFSGSKISISEPEPEKEIAPEPESEIPLQEPKKPKAPAKKSKKKKAK